MELWLTLLGLCVAFALLFAGCRVILKAREDAWAQASLASDNLRLALTRDIARNLTTYDLSLQGAVAALAEPGIDRASPGVRQRALFDTSATAKDLGAILVIDADGRIVEDSTSPVPHTVNLADRDYFLVHRDRPDAGLFISRPYRSRIADGDERISISRRLPTADGHFAGVVEGALRLASFQRLFSQLDVGPRGVIALIRDDGRLLARYPQGENDVDRDVSGTAAFRRFSQADHGRFVAESGSDGVERLYTFGKVPGLPLILTVNRATADILEPWRQRTLLIVPVLAVLFCSSIATSLLFRREIRRRNAAEAELRSLADELATLATRDGLTGIPNRRAFDLACDTEWRRAIRDRAAPVSLLMIDVDMFKAYNDRFGHAGGDDVLRAVARTLQGQVGRATDLVARFGGEEFAALLPDTDRAGAAAIGERMRSAVSALHIRHPGSPHGRVTISVGVATCHPLGGQLVSTLIDAADAALYAAKRGGRDRVEVGTRVDIGENLFA